ncbi:hypothetical protein [Sinomonas sp. ASV322]|uniref:hypothetical protein n=1 Tax=Sinomonas sp. ASV322 TaxID=3041920 RepID=UPI0027DD8575|nr:hypothetical protein [Sinomonas sp. ASV322]MDQ4502187.1 hypothetical protein [Sinomonas sp. ASV322]
MAGISYGTPYVPPAPPVPLLRGLKLLWRGPGKDAPEWDLTAPQEGLGIVREGVEGLSFPAYQHIVQESPALAGQWHRGSRAKARRVFWPLCIWADASSDAWAVRDAAFWASLGDTLEPGQTGTWTVVTPAGSRRHLACRFEDDGGHAFSHDPFQKGWEVYGIAMAADGPYWASDPISQAWGASASRAFLPSAPGEPYWVTSGSLLGAASITNPGDVPAWPRWTVVGGSTSVSAGVGGSVVEIPFPVPHGKAVVVDTDPRAQTAKYGDWDEATRTLSNAVDRTRELGAADFAPVPAGQNLPLSIAITGGGSVTAEITPLHRKAW